MSIFTKAIIGNLSESDIDMLTLEQWAAMSGAKLSENVKGVASNILQNLNDNERAVLLDWLYSEWIKYVMRKWLEDEQLSVWKPLPYVRGYGDKNKDIEKEFESICRSLYDCDRKDGNSNRKDTFVALVMFLRNYSDLMFFIYKDVNGKLPLFDMLGRFTFYIPMYTVIEFLINNVDCFIGSKSSGKSKKVEEFWKLVNDDSLKKVIEELREERNKSVHWQKDPNYGWGYDNPTFKIDAYIKYRKAVYRLLTELNSILD